jgi:hypothetical protein
MHGNQRIFRNRYSDGLRRKKISLSNLENLRRISVESIVVALEVVCHHISNSDPIFIEEYHKKNHVVQQRR